MHFLLFPLILYLYRTYLKLITRAYIGCYRKPFPSFRLSFSRNVVLKILTYVFLENNGELNMVFSTRLNQLVENQLRSRRSRRCVLHSLDYQKVRTPWKEIWDIMRPQCREEVLLIDARSLMITLECYLQKHRLVTQLLLPYPIITFSLDICKSS